MKPRIGLILLFLGWFLVSLTALFLLTTKEQPNINDVIDGMFFAACMICAQMALIAESNRKE